MLHVTIALSLAAVGKHEKVPETAHSRHAGSPTSGQS